MSLNQAETISFARLKEVLPVPDLLHMQKQSYDFFIQKGLDELLKSIFPIQDVAKTLELQYISYELEEPKFTPMECRERDMHYARTLKVRFRLVNRETGEMKEQDVLFGPLPIMTENCTFIINGAERCVVSQLTRSSGIYFSERPAKPPLKSFHCKVIPNRGSWVEMESHDEEGILVRLERAKKIPATKLLKALGFGNTTAEVLALFAEPEVVEKPSYEKIVGCILNQDAMDPDTNEILLRKGQMISEDLAKEERIWKKIAPLKLLRPHPLMERTAQKDDTETSDEALVSILKEMRPGESQKPENARNVIWQTFFDNKRYDLGEYGRFQISKKFGINFGRQDLPRSLIPEDFKRMIQYLLDLHKGKGYLDDVDHLGNRRVRAVGELLANHLRVAFNRLAKMVQERMMIQDKEEMTPQSLVNIRPVVAGINEFFGTGQLSQFMDQTNPLSELTNKRRVSAMGPGGLTRERAGIEVRDVHHTHYSRICPIETPEGPNIGLINSLSVYAKVNELGFIEAPYRRVKNGRVTDEIDYLTADDEDRVVIAQANAPLDEKGYLASDKILCRFQRHHILASPSEVQYMDVSPKQIVSASASLIPFLEHDDANRALMGSNMQRQAVPLVKTEAPLVATGMEKKVAQDSGAVVIAREKGVVKTVEASEIIVESDDGTMQRYSLRRFDRSNQSTCIDQKPIVKEGERVRKGQIIADGAATSSGELALGKNTLVAFLPWEGYNFEDAIIVSEKLVKEDTFTSIHIEQYETEARDTKLGPEEITAELSNIPDEMLKNLDEAGIIRVGAHVNPDDILVGKITPKGETELTPEERLLRAIFGEKAKEVRDTSLRLPHGGKGIVIACRVLRREDGHELSPGVNALVRVYVAQKRPIQEGDKMAGRHGNKGVISKVAPENDMPYLPDGTPIEIILNPLGVPSRMNLGQILEAHLGWVAHILGVQFITPVFDGATEEQIMYLLGVADLHKWGETKGYLKGKEAPYVHFRHAADRDARAQAEGHFARVMRLFQDPGIELYTAEEKTQMAVLKLPRASSSEYMESLRDMTFLELLEVDQTFNGYKKREVEALLKQIVLRSNGKVTLYNGKTGEPYEQEVTVGYMYMMKLIHMADDKIHARSTGPYALVTQQPLGGKAQFGGQRFGEMEVWALEAYGAASTLQELLTVKSDDVVGRVKTYEAIIRGMKVLEPGVPESFRVLVKEMQGIGLDVRLIEQARKDKSREQEFEQALRSASEELAKGLTT